MHVNCGDQNVWALDDHGQIYMRIGVKAPSNAYMNPAWVPVEGTTNSRDATFVKVYVGPHDWKV